MGLNETPSSERIHISFFGKRNAGKSSLVNAFTGQELSVVSDVKGTTTDPVHKAMELLPMGPVMIIDTPGIDDKGQLGELRVKKSRQILNKTDVAILVVDSSLGISKEDEELISEFKEKDISYIVVYNKIDELTSNKLYSSGSFVSQVSTHKNSDEEIGNPNKINVSAKTGENIEALKEKVASLAAKPEVEKKLVADLIEPSDFVILLTPIDKSAPKGRLILPQQQVIREVIDSGAIAIVLQENEFSHALSNLAIKPKLVVTDSQIFKKAAEITPENVNLTSFSILFARYKGTLDTAVKGARVLNELIDGDKVLISEGCTHHRQCEDIGTVKLPKWIRDYTQKDIRFEFTSGREFPEKLDEYKLVIHCGGCMLNEREMKYRQKNTEDQCVPFTNYGIAIAYMQGILERSIALF